MGCYVWISFPLCVLLVICVHPERNCFSPALLVVRHRMDDSNCSVCLISSWGFGLTEQGLGLCLQCHCLKGSASLEVRAQLFPVTVSNCNMSTTESSLHLFPLRNFTLSIISFFAFLQRPSHSIRLWLQLFGKGLLFGSEDGFSPSIFKVNSGYQRTALPSSNKVDLSI